MLIMYKISPVTYHLFKKLVNFKFAGIANVIADKEICKEFIQNNASPNLIAEELNKLLTDSNYTQKIKAEMQKIREALGEKDGSLEAAKLARQLL